MAPGCDTAVSCWHSLPLGAFPLCPERRGSSCQSRKCYPKHLPSFSMHVSLRTEFGASFHPLFLLKGSKERHQPQMWICRALALCWLWKGLRAEAESPECIYCSSVLFQLVLLFWFETQGLCVSLDVTDFRQAKGTADGSFGPSNGVNVAPEKPEGTLDSHGGSLLSPE